MVKILYDNYFRINQICYVLIGSIPGALLRWQINNDFWSNVFGAAFLGIIAGVKCSQTLQLFFIIGFCGSLTTFSGWMLASFELLLKGFILQSFFLILGTFVSGFLALIIGFLMGKKLRQAFLP